MSRSKLLAILALVGSTIAGFGASAFMQANTREYDACIGCGIAVFAGVVIGCILAASILLQARHRK